MIIPAILEKDIKECERKIKLVEGACSAVQIDILDNTIVPGETFQDLQNLEEIKTLADITIHFMVKDPINLIRKLGFLFPPNTTKINGVSTLITQVADIQETENFLKYAKDLGYKTGISINSDQDILPLEGLIQGADIIQFMGVEPGKQGGEFIPSVLEKIKNFKNKYPEKTTQIDGGINDANITSVLETGVDNIIIGSAIFNSDDPKKKLLEFSTIFEQKRKNLTEQTSEIKINKKKNKRPLMICFLGGAAWKNEDEPYIQAKETAKLLAENGYGIVNGGGPGVMRASTEGAHEGGAGVLAVTYHPNKPKRHFEGVDPENKFDLEVKTLDYFDRTKILLQTSDIHVIFRGSIGTLSEFGMSWENSYIHEPNNKPIILFGDHWRGIIKSIEENMSVRGGETEILKICTTPQEVLEYIKSIEDKILE
ncbi:MAG TPA: LOG family protein [bacterium]|jgi:ribulose-phosphate 3-epimerase|nr:LOG family protein [bacterium]